MNKKLKFPLLFSLIVLGFSSSVNAGTINGQLLDKSDKNLYFFHNNETNKEYTVKVSPELLAKMPVLDTNYIFTTQEDSKGEITLLDFKAE